MKLEWAHVFDSIPQFQEAAIITIRLAFFGILIALIVGLVCSLIQYFKIPVIHKIIGIYIELSRNTPLLIQLFFLYYGLPKLGVTIEAETIAIVGLGFLGGSYMSEAFRSGMEAIPPIQMEAGKALGLNKFQLARYVLVPQAFSISIPALGANLIFLLKETSVFSIIAIPDLVYTMKELNGMYYHTNEYMFLLVVAYAIILIPISILLSLLERRVRYGTFGS